MFVVLFDLIVVWLFRLGCYYVVFLWYCILFWLVYSLVVWIWLFFGCFGFGICALVCEMVFVGGECFWWFGRLVCCFIGLVFLVVSGCCLLIVSV